MAVGLNDLVSQTQPEKLAVDFQFTEGPVWHRDGYLLFSDIPANIINRYTPGGGIEPHVKPSRHSNGLTYDREGRLIACEHGAGRYPARRQTGQWCPSHRNGTGSGSTAPTTW